MCCESKSGQFKGILRKIPADKKNKEDTQNIEVIDSYTIGIVSYWFNIILFFFYISRSGPMGVV